MLTRTLSIALMAVVALTLATTCSLHAAPTQVASADAGSCDPLFIPTDVDEIGDFSVFPPDESLSATSVQVTLPACISTDDPGILDERVSITNLTGRDLTDVWYVANPATTITNVDGYANQIPFPVVTGENFAFRIDSLGVHRALVAESGLPNNIWEAGETWDFVLQDYFNANGLPANAINSIGVGDGSIAAGVIKSSGSIIALPFVPEPGSVVLALLGGVGITLFGRRRGAVS